jgi:predicted RNA-binding Zn ribbon-like protein
VTNPFQLVAGHSALDFVNTLDWRFRESGPEELLKDYAGLLRFAAQAGLVGGEPLRHLRKVSEAQAAQAYGRALELRELLAQIFYALADLETPPVAAVVKLDHLMHEAQSKNRLRWNRSRFELGWPGGGADADLPAWMLARSAAELLTGESAQLLRDCENAECRWLFLDTSKNHTRLWCDMKLCGNRMKARRFKAQRRA